MIIIKKNNFNKIFKQALYEIYLKISLIILFSFSYSYTFFFFVKLNKLFLSKKIWEIWGIYLRRI